jgi:hypothetical protein
MELKIEATSVHESLDSDSDYYSAIKIGRLVLRMVETEFTTPESAVAFASGTLKAIAPQVEEIFRKLGWEE